MLFTSTSAASQNDRRKTRRQRFATPRSIAALALLTESKNVPEFSLRRLECNPDYVSMPDQRNRSFARLLVTTVERHRGQIDKVLNHFIKSQPKSNKKQDAFVRACLRLGAAQLLFLGTPKHAALKETIEVLHRNSEITVPAAKIKFVNAVLRRLSQEGQNILTTRTSIEDNVAPWLLEELVSSWGEENTKKILFQFMSKNSNDISINFSASENRSAILKQVQREFGQDSLILPHGSIRVGESVKGAVTQWPLYSKGLWWVQDASAALPALALYNIFGDETPNTHVVDCCSAPGGKTAQLISLGFGRVTAIEANKRRSKRLMENLERLQMADKYTLYVDNVLHWFPNEQDEIKGILLDVPCSATGTGSRRPDVLRRDKDLGSLLLLQQDLARHCAENILKPGGVLVYSTCSLLEKESEEQVQKLLDRSSARLDTIPFVQGEIPGFDEAIDENGWLRVLPGSLKGSLDSCDGFFVAKLRKIS